MIPIRSFYGTFLASLRSVGTAMTMAAVGVYLHRTGRVKKEAIDAFWVLMQRQVLMKAPPQEPAQPNK